MLPVERSAKKLLKKQKIDKYVMSPSTLAVRYYLISVWTVATEEHP